jgi:Arc/MetJ family transcription regulator
MADRRVFGWELMAPDDSRLGDDELLAEAVRIATNQQFRSKRRAFHKWRRELVSADAPEDVVRSELEELLCAYRDATTLSRRRMRVLNVFAIAGIASSIGGAMFFPPISAAGGFIAAGRFAADNFWRDLGMSDHAKSVAIVHDARRHFGWK